MVRTFRYPLLPTSSQEATLEHWLVLCQRLYNGALEQRKDAWRKQKKSVTRYDQQKELTQLRKEAPEYDAVSARALRSSLHRLDEAFRGFFRRLKRGEKPGFPRFRSRDRYDSMGIGRVLPEGDKGDRVRVPNLGLVRFKLYRPLNGVVRDVTLKRTAKRWYVCFSVDLGEAPPKRVVRSATGIDVGLTTFATMADGSTIENPRYMQAAAEKLAERQRRLARKKRGSGGRRKAKQLVARAHEHIRNQRLDFARKASKALFERYDLIAHEDLNIRGMVHGNLAKSIHDAAWGVFLRCLALKAEEAGAYLVAVDPRGTTKRCSRCGDDVPKTLSEREHVCDRCGLRLGRDHNAAINIHALGLSAAPAAKATRVQCGH